MRAFDSYWFGTIATAIQPTRQTAHIAASPYQRLRHTAYSAVITCS
jgi:hypothetical protein